MAVNLYATLGEYKNFATARGQTSTTDATDDGVIALLLESASRYLDLKTQRRYFPSVEAHLFDIEAREIILDDDLLSVIAVTNGDAIAVSASDYLLKGYKAPHWCVSLRDTSSVAWATNSSGSAEQVISINGWWGYHDNFTARAWLQVGTLGAAITDATTLAFTMTAGHSISAYNILKIESEIYNVSTVVTNTITPIKRGDNGSTAATHANGTAVYAWQPMELAKQAALEIAHATYMRRFGKNTGEAINITSAGVIVTPEVIPATAQSFINTMERKVWR